MNRRLHLSSSDVMRKFHAGGDRETLNQNNCGTFVTSQPKRDSRFAMSAADALLIPYVPSATTQQNYQNARTQARRSLCTQLKLAMPVPQPTPWIQTVWIPGISGARSVSDTIIFAVNDSSLPSPCR